jgi:hypothetical protein
MSKEHKLKIQIMLIIRQASVCETPNYEGLNRCRNLASAAHKSPLLFGKMCNEFDFHLLALRLERKTNGLPLRPSAKALATFTVLPQK